MPRQWLEVPVSFYLFNSPVFNIIKSLDQMRSKWHCLLRGLSGNWVSQEKSKPAARG